MGAGASAASKELPPIDESMSNEIQRHTRACVRGDVDDWYPETALSYATGSRKGVDAEGAGPGMIYAAGLIQALFAAEIDTFSGLQIPPGENWKTLM